MKNISLFTVLFFPFFLLAQQQGNIWYFGEGAGLDFASGEPVLLTDGAIQTIEGCATYSDAEGNLLFYTNGGGESPQSDRDGGTIWNRNHEVMYDMGGVEGGGYSARQSSLIVPKPSTPDVYLLFTMEQSDFNNGGVVDGQPNGRGLSYFEIDMTLSGGLGAVTDADQRLQVPLFEALSGTIHANGEDYWILAADDTEDNNRFVRLLVDENGPQDPAFVPVDMATPIGSSIKITPSSELLYSQGHLFIFNNANGAISESIATLHPQEVGQSIAFSANSRYFYAVEQFEEVVEVVQYDLATDDIPASRFVFDTLETERTYGQMQLAPDGNLYFLDAPFFNVERSRLSVIRCANTPNPELATDVIELPGGGDYIPYFGLPNYTDHLFANTGPTLDLELGADSTLCQGDVFAIGDTLPNPGAAYEWSTGDTTATIEVFESDAYSLTLTNACGTVADTIDLEFVDCDSACQIFMPNTFTPNGDDTNETFGFVSNCEEPTFEIYQLVVYNRWGELIFETDTPNNTWDGTQENGTPAPSEVYFYRFNYQLGEDEEPSSMQGDVSLVR
ncbi:MAG: T9SS type B sorting domain-containing protein [Bacteroidetes bacterium]|jgi:gliding motility-associated-like protein|nr:T9SS type B sorting domain-containing protein [Bacteroidota bacterium]